MIIEENVLYTTAIFSEDKKDRYLLRKTWNSEKKKAAVIMLHPASNQITTLDLTTTLVQNNLDKLGYGSVDILNICPRINPLGKEIGEIESAENDEQIKKSAEEADTIVVCWGTAGSGNRKINRRINNVLRLLESYKDKVQTTVDGRNIKNLHPLTPSLRSNWMLASFDFPDLQTEPTEKPAMQTESAENQDVSNEKKTKNSRKQAPKATHGVRQDNEKEEPQTEQIPIDKPSIKE